MWLPWQDEEQGVESSSTHKARLRYADCSDLAVSGVAHNIYLSVVDSGTL